MEIWSGEAGKDISRASLYPVLKDWKTYYVPSKWDGESRLLLIFHQLIMKGEVLFYWDSGKELRIDGNVDDFEDEQKIICLFI